ncbi:FKBP-type peptidyl-prolyl cis-trans isomerase [Pelagicoccus albus]|uniref:Peptidyl-prolyl cis-trans isomerase n=1 Tax=Pelagicoccus albus TaxID=415222 RepID=A0A7X1EBC2_9BACT|nr:FKBP-type peptidyl-prolyl cis-trans isomerase [Pelagicoccus albus]MBC2607642.1 FKBP-type peptidyl-prolyl cis-trans isomerase [Pelagicoccus albus]
MKTELKSALVCSLAVLFLLAACTNKEEPNGPEALELLNSQIEQIEGLYPASQSTPSGLHYVVQEEGTGEFPQSGQVVTAHYHGTFIDGSVFDSSIDRGHPISFPVGVGRVIKGWDEAFLGMKKGEKRTLIIPSALAYGPRGSPPAIPRNAILVFEVELVDFK